MSLSYSRRAVPHILQSEAAECGLACLAMVAGFYGLQTDLNTLRRRFPLSMSGMTFKTLLDIADDMGMNGRPVKAELDELSGLQCPAVLHWNLNHFVVLTGLKRSVRGGRYLINDPARGAVSLTEGEVSRCYTGVALELTPSERFQRRKEKTPLRLSQLWNRMIGLKSTLIQILALSLLMQLIAFATPFYMQLAVDNAAPAFDTDFLAALAIGFSGLAIVNVMTSTLREIILLKLGSTLSYQLVSNLFRQLVRLPMSYFEKRHTGDIISRFDSTQPITDMLSHGLISALIDGLMALLTLALMFYYSVVLASIATGSLLIYMLIRAAWFNSLQLANVSAITARAAESSTMIETVRGMAAIKLFARETERHRFWQSKRANVVNANVVMGRIQIWFDAINNGVMALENILFVWLAIHMVIEAKFTVGMIFAFQAYKQQFMGAATRLVGQWVQLQLVDMHLNRIGDIALTPAESDESAAATAHKPALAGEIEIRNVHFGYGVGENPVLKGVNLTVKAGETIALIGPSGGGKTTLMKLMLGFYPPNQGDILIDGERFEHFGLRRFRTQIGAVLQEDVLYAGSLAENIGFFDDALDMERVKKVAHLACIHDEIMAMPMGYETLVGDMGSTLSGGQKQRVLLARALYHKPRILFLDEGTAHLDVQSEAEVNASISALGITRVIIAHRPETIRMAGRVVALTGGRIMEMAMKPVASP